MKSFDKEADISKTFYVVRMFAIISVATAHLGTLDPAVVDTIKSMIGTIGVPVFLICSGYYFRRTDSWKDFFVQRKKIIVPWLILGSCTYILEFLRGGGYSNGPFRWTIGYLTWLYYVPILLCLYVIFQVSVEKKYCLFWIGIFVISWTLSYNGTISENNGYFTQYMVPFNHIGFFALGILLKSMNLEKILFCKKVIKLLGILVYLILSSFYFMTGKIGYWSNVLSVPYEIMSFVVLLWVAYLFRNRKLLIDIGKRTYFIFFIHMQFGIYIVYKALIILRLRSVIPDMIQVLLDPVMIVAVTYLIWKVLSVVAHKLKIEDKSWIIAV